MATWEDVSRVAAGLPELVEGSRGDSVDWRVRNKPVAWERPLGKSDFAALGDAAPDGPILAVRVPHVGVKDALIAEEPTVFFTTPHFNGYPAILVRLAEIDVSTLTEVMTEGWLCQAPKRLAAEFLAGDKGQRALPEP